MSVAFPDQKISAHNLDGRCKPRAMRVAHLIHSMAYGGVETALLNWLRALDPELVCITLYCFSNPGGTEKPFLEAAHQAGFCVHTIPWSRRKPILRSARTLAHLLRRDKVQIVHCHNTYADLVGLLAGKLSGTRTVTTLYVWGRLGFVRNVLQWIDRRLLPFFDQVTVHCQETLRGTVQRGFPAERCRLLPCGFEVAVAEVTAQERTRLRASLRTGPDDTALIHVARFWPEKAHDVVLQGFSIILRHRPNVMLWLLGVGPLLEPMRTLARELGVADRVVFLGFRSDLSSLLASADVQVHPSDMEGVPLAICQGMAQGLPIVATRVGGIAEVLQDRVSGLLVDCRKPEAFADAVLELLNDEELRNRLSGEAARFIAKDYSLASAARRVEQVYVDLMRRTDAAGEGGLTGRSAG